MGSELDRALHERPHLRHMLQLVEGEHAVGLTTGIAEVLPMVPLLLEVEPGREPVLQGSERQGTAEREAGAVIEPVEIDVREGRRVLEAARDAEYRQRCLAGPAELPPDGHDALPRR